MVTKKKRAPAKSKRKKEDKEVMLIDKDFLVPGSENRTFYVTIFIILAIFLMASPQLLREYRGNSALIGDEPYFHLRAAEYILEKDPSSNPSLSDIEDIASIITPYDYILAGLISLGIGGILLSKILPIILGVIFYLLMYLLIERFGKDKIKTSLLMICLVLTPGLVFLFAFSNALSLLIVLGLFALYLYTCEGRLVKFLSLPIIFVMSMFNIAFPLIVLFTFFIYMIKQRKGHLAFLLNILVALVVFYFSTPHVYVQYNLLGSFTQTSALTQLLTDFGSLKGFGIYSLMLGFIGLIYSWKNKLNFIGSYILLFFLIFYYPNLGQDMLIPAGIIMSLFAGLGLYWLFKLDWKTSKVRDLTLIVIICGLLFSSFSLANRLSAASPTPEYIDALSGIKGMPQGSVLSHYSNSDIISYYSGLDSSPNILLRYEDSFDMREELNAVDTLFGTTRLEDAKTLFYNQDIRYIFIDQRMTQGLVWQEKVQGLQFLFRNKETFKKVYSGEGIEIWQVLNNGLSDSAGFERLQDGKS